jgi:hypothetical protein
MTNRLFINMVDTKPFTRSEHADYTTKEKHMIQSTTHRIQFSAVLDHDSQSFAQFNATSWYFTEPWRAHRSTIRRWNTTLTRRNQKSTFRRWYATQPRHNHKSTLLTIALNAVDPPTTTQLTGRNKSCFFEARPIYSDRKITTSSHISPARAEAKAW